VSDTGWGGKRPGAGRKPGTHLTVVATDGGKPAVQAKPAGDALKLGLPREGLAIAVARSRAPVHMSPFKFPDFPAGAVPPKKMQLGQDAAMAKLHEWAGAQDQTIITADPFSFGPGGSMLGGLGGPFQGMGFLGYTFLAELMQRAEYRVIVETIAEEMTRKAWLVKSKSDDKGKEDEIKKVTSFMEALDVRGALRLAAVHDGSFGRSHLFLDAGDGSDWENREELVQPIGDGADAASRAKVTPEKPLRRIVNVEPVWAYPTNYNSSNPIAPDWYKPSQWFVMARPMHATRLLTLVGRPVPDLLKPAYAFGGLSMVQMAMPYVNRWLRTVDNVNDLINNFSTVGLKTDLQTSLQNDGDQLFKRVQLFNQFRDNQGLMLTQNGPEGAAEDFWNVAVPLGTLDKLQAQAQEHMAAVARIPLVKLLGISPTGLNATAEPEIRVFYDHILAYQEAFFRPPLTTIFRFAQLSTLGAVDPDLTVEFEPLWALDEKGEAELRKDDAETDTKLIDAGVLHPIEVRKRIANDPDTPYAGIDIEDVPDLLEEEEEGLEPEGGRPQPQAGKEGDHPDMNGKAATDGFSFDEWKEGDHPRDNEGKFGSGGGGSPHEGKAGKFTAHGKGNLAAQGFKPRKRGNGTSATEAMQVAWHVAEKTKKPQTLTQNFQGWVLVRPDQKIPYGHPHVVVEPDGTVTRYKINLEGAGDDRAIPFAGDEAPPDILGISGEWEPHEAALSEALDLDRLGYLQGLKRLSFLPGDLDRWNSDYDADLDQVTIEGKFAGKDERDKVRTFLHEAGHRGALRVDKTTWRAFLKQGLGDRSEFLATANPVHLESFQETGAADLPGEVFAESYARHLIGLRQPPELDAFWKERIARRQAADAKTRAAGLALVTPDGMALFLKRAGTSDHLGEWCFPGGMVEGDETPEETAIRETREETGWIAPEEIARPRIASQHEGYTILRQRVGSQFIPTLNAEHSAYAWAPLREPPSPAHPGLMAVISRLASDEAGQKGAEGK
jgi:phage-related protein (TIGR01555 family)